MNHTGSLNLGTSANYCSVSRDGRFLAAVGDSYETFLYDYQNLKKIHIFKEFKDYGFSCAFDSSSNYLASSSQDGSTIVIDIRKGKVLKTFKSLQKGAKGAFRCVRFSQVFGIDLMAFSEHTKYLHIVDTRNFNDEQILEIDQTGDAHISGFTFSSDSLRLVVGEEENLHEFRIDVLKRRMFSEGELL